METQGTYLWHLDLVTLLEVLGESLDELLGWDILHGDSHLSVDNTFYLLKLKTRVLSKKGCLLPPSLCYPRSFV